jgi:hypothetical protein
MRRQLIAATIAAVAFLACLPALPQGAPYAGLAYSAFVDYAKVHSELVRLCATSYPGTESALQAAISQWTAARRPALDEIRALVRDQAVQKMGMPKDEVNSRLEQAGAKMTAFLLNGMSKDANLEAACRGQYAEQLSSPEMNYTSILERMKRDSRK